jgi:4-amino-4-deoxy-L-arabinose transferase-like glycosyltransferase
MFCGDVGERLRLTRLRGGELLAGAGGALLLVSLFLPWFGKVSPVCEPFPGYSCGRNFSAWDKLEVTLIVLLIAAVAGLAVAFFAARSDKTDWQITSAAIAVAIAFVSTLLVLYRILEPVGKLDPRVGLYLGLAACLAVTYGSWRAVRNQYPSEAAPPGRPRRASRRRSRSSSDSPRPTSGRERRRQRKARRSR